MNSLRFNAGESVNQIEKYSNRVLCVATFLLVLFYLPHTVIQTVKITLSECAIVISVLAAIVGFGINMGIDQ